MSGRSRVFSGDGALSGGDSASLSGVNWDRSYIGTDTLETDCTGTVALNFCPPRNCVGPAKIVAAPDGSEILFINTIPGVTVLGQFKKQ